MYTASERGDISSVRAALDRGEDVNNRKGHKNTPLMIAVYHGYTSVVSLLLSQSGVDLTARDRCGDTALHWACMGGADGIVRMLLSRLGEEGCNARDNLNETPLMVAVQYNRLTTVRVMCEQERVRMEGTEELAR